MARSQGAKHSPSVWMEIWHTLRLAWRLLRDPRVSPFLKVLIPALMVAYALLPVDIVPDLIPVLGQLDDLAFLILIAQFLIEMSPPSVVAEHEFDLSESATSRPHDPSPGKIVETTYHIVE